MTFFKSLLLFAALSLAASVSFADYKYAEFRCSVDFKTSEGATFPVSDFVYCSTSDTYDFTCTGSVIGNSLDTICSNSAGEVSKALNWSAPRVSTEIPGTLQCGI